MVSIEERLQQYVDVVAPYLEPNYPAECGETFEQWAARRAAGDGPKMNMDPDRLVWSNLDDSAISPAEHGAFARETLSRYPDLRRERVRISPFIGRFAVATVPGDIEEIADGGCVVEQVVVATATDGSRVRIPLCVIFYVKDGKIVRLHEYQDRAVYQPWADGHLAADLKRTSVGK
ncbi:hypothetical protein ACFYTQ_25640 [Nocardia sp. NPDC004068]|uniref:hypothetical protein n=1 Tax=Nocardia sp. NPDC004068 TaxID=3364303 RepID=UPI0036B24CBE